MIINPIRGRNAIRAESTPLSDSGRSGIFCIQTGGSKFMKILVYGVNFSPELTGIGKYTGEMAEWLATRGHEVVVVTAPPYYPEWKVSPGFSNFYEVTKANGLTVYRNPIWVPVTGRTGPGGIKRLLHLFSFAVSSWPTLIAVMLRLRPDVVFTVEPSLFSALNIRMANVFFRGRTWMHIQDFEVDAAFELNLLKGQLIRKFATALECWIMNGFDRVSTISRKMLEKLAEKKISKDRIRAFPNWIDLSAIFPLTCENEFRRELGISESEVVVLYSGNLGEKQGVDALVELAHVWEEDPQIRMIVCGAGASREKFKESCATLRRLKILPLQPLAKLNMLLNSADIHLLPQKEGVVDLVMPSKLTGMLATGRPVVAMATLDSDVAYAVRECGYVVPPGAVNEFRQKIEDLAKDPNQRKKMGLVARRIAEKELSKEAVLGIFEQDLKRLVHHA